MKYYKLKPGLTHGYTYYQTGIVYREDFIPDKKGTLPLRKIMDIYPQDWALVEYKFFAPFRVGRKNSRAVLDRDGKEVVVFLKGLEYMAQEYCMFLNGKI